MFLPSIKFSLMVLANVMSYILEGLHCIREGLIKFKRVIKENLFTSNLMQYKSNLIKLIQMIPIVSRFIFVELSYLMFHQNFV